MVVSVGHPAGPPAPASSRARAAIDSADQSRQLLEAFDVARVTRTCSAAAHVGEDLRKVLRETGMDDVIELCGLDDFEALRLSAAGIDPDDGGRRPMRRRARLDSYPTDGELHAARTAKHREDRAWWNTFLWLSLFNLVAAREHEGRMKHHRHGRE